MNTLIGIPYQSKGRVPETGLDCWGLLRVFYARYMGVWLPSYSDEYENAFDNASSSSAIENHINEWIEVSDPQYGDAVLLRLEGRACHVGVYIGNNQMIHTQAGHDSVVDRLDGMRWKNRIKGFYRLASLVKAEQ